MRTLVSFLRSFLIMVTMHYACKICWCKYESSDLSSLHISALQHSLSESPCHFHQLHGKTLVSIQDCMDAVLLQQRVLKDQHPKSPKVIFIDASWYHRPEPTTNQFRNPIQEYKIGPRLPRAQYLDITTLATSLELFPNENLLNLPQMIPPPKLFALAMDAYGIRSSKSGVTDHVIIYARRGALFTPRTWFLFVSMGHDPNKVHLMQGSLEDWLEKGGPVESFSLMKGISLNDPNYNDAIVMRDEYSDCFNEGVLNVTHLFHSRYSTVYPFYQVGVTEASNICGKEEVLEAVNSYLFSHNKMNEGCQSKEYEYLTGKNTVIIDTRGSAYEQKGYIPSAVHLHYRKFVSPSNALVLQPKTILHNLFKEQGIDYLDNGLKIIITCGSGVSACHAFLALKELGRDITQENTKIYDGSWKEWGRTEGLPKILPDKK